FIIQETLDVLQVGECFQAIAEQHPLSMNQVLVFIAENNVII
ncbi:MAG: hypothetical protein ACI902_003222, partial [Psychroserpens sp.]